MGCVTCSVTSNQVETHGRALAVYISNYVMLVRHSEKRTLLQYCTVRSQICFKRLLFENRILTNTTRSTPDIR